MCLTIDREKTKKHSRLKSNKLFVFYKDFYVHKSSYILQTFWNNQSISFETEIIEPHEFFIEITNIGIKDVAISIGVIHAYVQKNNSAVSKQNSIDAICIPITVESNDIIAFGKYGDVCFSKYKIEKSTWQKIKKIS
jgi:hypothetical protein